MKQKHALQTVQTRTQDQDEQEETLLKNPTCMRVILIFDYY